MKKIILLSTAFICFVAIIYAQPGELDSAFGANGLVKTTLPTDNWNMSLAVQSDGKIIVGAVNGLARYNTDGSVDKTFGSDGVQAAEYYFSSIAIQSDGKIVALGKSLDGVTLLRYNINGGLDNAFSEDGKQPTNIRAYFAGSVIIQHDGKIVLATGDNTFALARYNSDGSLDNTFNATQVLAAGGSFSAALQEDGKILVTCFNTMARFNTDGSLDYSFDGDGIQNIGESESQSVAIQSDGKIVVAGGAYIGNTSYFALARYNTNGTLDNTFSGDGKQITSFSAYQHNHSVAIQNDGKILIAGGGLDGSDYEFAIARYNTDGSLDNTFSNDGIQITQGSDGQDAIFGLAIANNKLYAIGTSEYYPDNPTVLARYLLEETKVTTVRISNPLNHTSLNSPPDIELIAVAQAPGGTISKVEFYNGTTLLFSDNTPPYTFNWKNVPLGNYTLIAKATDNTGLIATSDEIHIKVVPNTAPVVRITAPTNNKIYHGSSVVVSAEASDGEGGSITKVEFYSGTTLLGTKRAAPYYVNWFQVPLGNYTLTAKATDNSGMITISAPVYISVVGNTPPLVKIASPVDGASYTALATVLLSADASDPGGTIKTVDFYNGNILIYTMRSTPRKYLWTDVPAGNYTLTAKATDNSGLVTTSAPVHISVVGDKAPTVKITSPVDGANYTAMATVLLSADAIDPDGKVETVDFYNGNTLIFTETWPPFHRQWYNVPAGDYIITAKSTDNNGKSTTSAPVHITVLGPDFLTANITNPGNGTSFNAPAAITLTADVKGPNEIVKTDFYSGSTLIFTEDVFPYSNKWRNIPAGNYSITAKATDSKGNVATSVPVAITVKSTASATLVSNKPVSLNSKTNLRDAVSVQLMPNPANNILNIRTTGLQRNKQLIVSLISASGVIMKTKQFSSATQTIQLNVSSLASGVYTIKLLSGDRVLYKQFVKL